MPRPWYLFVRVISLSLIVACGVCRGVSLAGGNEEAPCHLQERIEQASPGYIINGGGCVERSAVKLHKRLTLRNLTVKGSDDWSGEFTEVNGNYRSRRTVPEFEEPRETDDWNNTELCETADDEMCVEAEMVFVNGRYLRQLPDGSDPGPGEFALDEERRVILGSNPGNALVEVVVRQMGIHMYRGSAGTVLDNVLVTQVGNTVGPHGLGTGPALKNNGQALTVKDSEVSWVHGTGMSCGGGVRCEITGTEVHHAGAAGMNSYKARPLIFDHNLIHHNCTSLPDVHYNDTFTCSGLKIIGRASVPGSVTHSEFYKNDHSGIWLDGDANMITIADNRIHHNEERGIEIENSSDV
ncbi:MAG: right-handed parallel beta-helix repeat-containing protein, partial [Nitrococcus sp.]|nr:right-handed parallel beta-helix repeat-containing protein [Nitrococcus sp.]